MKKHRFIWNERENIRTLWRFCLVGVGNTLVDFIVFFLLTSFGVSVLLAQVCSYTAGVVNSYVWNRMWTFQVKRKANIGEFFRFLIVNVMSLAMTLLLLFLCRDVWHWPLFVGKLIATLGGIAVNFAGSRFWVFTSKPFHS
ncbi:Putative flippase GtrA (transmembrane translocase of bactoprenol-linked glucose) [Parageobacillus thermantarcticus]|uniref:Putative flippase GtrA (Transmembrane translocase of bactoprenol-linked glucose) n=1 Tax=Parageobacillus thermantarcticus TaxID=186116 RepID=A0A1I0TEG9_9BACL|nr:GtrA family protein [Parageobacillus thermantarcticus]SFA50139.1 Putative flippase GtrA (transmembrane translocase of bactoprenol-linked glucose) [Parageobacillus thermantarcticus]